MNRLLAPCTMLAVLITAPVIAGDAPNWRWTLKSADFMHSEITISRADGAATGHVFPCSLDEANRADMEETPTIDVVRPDSHPEGLLIVVCNTGAHAVQISVIDPNVTNGNAEFSRTGSFFALWEIRGGRLIVQFDQPCDNNCETGYETMTLAWPSRMLLANAGSRFAIFLHELQAAVARRDRAYVEARVADGFYFARDHGGMFVDGASAVFNFNQVFVLDNARLFPEYRDQGWNRLAAMLEYHAFEIDERGDLCAPYGATDLQPWPTDQLCFTRAADGNWQIGGFVGGGD